MTMRYFQNAGKTYGYDDAEQISLIDAAIASQWTEVTGSWPPAPTAAEQLFLKAYALLNGTVSVTSASTPSLNGNYTITPADQAHLSVEIQSIMLNGTFADGISTVAWPDASGALHAFTVAEFKAFATALGAFVAACLKCQNGASTTLPNAALTIA